MSRRISPPKPPVTGNPHTDNDTRNAWREHRTWLESIGPVMATAAVSQGAWFWPENPPRKAKKAARQALWAAAFIHPAEG